MLAILAFAALKSGNVTVDLGPARARELMPRLGAAVGQALRVEARLADEVVMVAARDVSRDDVLARTAHVLRARWEREPNGLILRRPSEVQRTLEREAFERRVARFETVFRRNRDWLAKLPAPDARAGEVVKSLRDMVEKERTGRIEVVNGVYEPQYMTAATILLRQLLDRVGPRELAAVTDSAVYAQNPTMAQRRMDPGTFVEEYRQTQERMAVGPREVEGLSPYLADVVFGPLRRPGKIGKVLLTFYPIGGTFSTAVKIFGADGRDLDGAGLREQFDDGIAMTGRTERPALAKALQTKGERAALSAASAALVAAFPRDPDATSFGYISPGAGVPPEVLDALANPAEREPLAFAAADALRGLAKGQAIAACLPDTLFRYAHLAADGKEIRLGPFEAMARDLGDVEIARNGGWLVVRSNDPIRDEARRLPRASLGAFTQKAIRLREVSVRDYAIYKHRADGRDASNTISSLYQFLLAQAGVQHLHSPDMLPSGLWRLLGSLPDAQWDALVAGGTVPVGRLAESRPRIRQWARFIGERTPDEDGAKVTDLGLDVTECIPTGIPLDATLRLVPIGMTVIQRASPQPEPEEHILLAHRPMHAEEMAEELDDAARERKVSDPFSLMTHRYRVGHQGKYRFVLRLARGVQLTNELPLRPDFVGGAPVPWKEVPAEYREAVARKLAELVEQRKASGGD